MDDTNPAEKEQAQPIEKRSCAEVVQRSQKMIQETRVLAKNAEQCMVSVDTSFRQSLALFGLTVEELYTLASLLPENVQKNLVTNPMQVLEERLQDTQQDTADDIVFGDFLRHYLSEQPYIETQYTIHPEKETIKKEGPVFLHKSRPKRWI